MKKICAAIILCCLFAMPARAYDCISLYGDSLLTSASDGGMTTAELLAAKTGLPVYDEAVGGVTTIWLLNRAKDTMQQYPSCLFVILAANNDVAAGETYPKETAKRLRSIAAKSRNHASGELIITPMPVSFGSPVNEFNREVGQELMTGM